MARSNRVSYCYTILAIHAHGTNHSLNWGGCHKWIRFNVIPQVNKVGPFTHKEIYMCNGMCGEENGIKELIFVNRKTVYVGNKKSIVNDPCHEWIVLNGNKNK